MNCQFDYKEDFVPKANYRDSINIKYYGKPELYNLKNDLPFLQVYHTKVQTYVRLEIGVEYKNKVITRLNYLSEILEDDQDKNIFEKSRKTALDFINTIRYTEYPSIVADSTGYVCFEWNNYKEYDAIIIRFEDENDVFLTAIKFNDKRKYTTLKFRGSIEETVDCFQKLIVS